MEIHVYLSSKYDIDLLALDHDLVQQVVSAALGHTGNFLERPFEQDWHNHVLPGVADPTADRQLEIDKK